MALALLVGGVHDGVGGVREADQVTAVLLRSDDLTLHPLLTVVQHHLIIFSAGYQSQPVVTEQNISTILTLLPSQVSNHLNSREFILFSL